MVHQSDSAGIPSIDWRMVIDSLDVPERIRLYRKSPGLFTPDHERAESSVAQWVSKIGRAESSSIDDRFVDLGIAESELPFIFGEVAIEASDLVPHAAWMDVCAEVRAWTASVDDSGLPASPFLSVDEEDEAIPFEHALVPWVDVATRMLRERNAFVTDVLTGDVLRAQQRRLLTNLSGFARFVFEQEFRKVRGTLYQGNDLAIGLLMSSNVPRVAYVKAVRRLLGIEADGRENWMLRYPALARLLGVRVVSWVRTLSEFVHRLKDDEGRIRTELNSGETLGGLVDLSFGSGDSHNGGRSVAICTFDGGRKVVYKPRSGSVDVVFAEVVERLNEFIEPNLRIRVPLTLDRGTWCWTEFISSIPCEDRDGLHAYHLRIGSLLAVIHMLQGNDFHLENIKAHGAFPVPIDLETVCVPDGTADDPDLVTDRASTMVNHSVLRTMLLPNVMGFKGARQRSLGAIQVAANQGQAPQVKKLSKVNTDFQRWVSVPLDTLEERPDSQAWTENGDSLAVEDQLAATSKGYESAYRSLHAHQEELLGEDSVIRRFAGTWIRVLNRATNVYYRLLYQSCKPEHLASGVDRWLLLQRLGLTIDRSESGGAGSRVRSLAVRLVEAESAALSEGDIAYFMSPGDGLSHWRVDSETGEPVEIEGTPLTASAVDCALGQVARMSETDLSLQLELQGDAYTSSVRSLARILHGASASDAVDQGGLARSTRPLRELVVDALVRIADSAIDSGQHLNWIDVLLDDQSETVSPAALDCNLYSGRGGLSLLFERAYRLLGDPRWLEIARGAIDLEAGSTGSPMLKSLEIQPPAGMMSRAGLMISAWAIGRHAEHGRYRELARTLSTSLSRKAVGKDDSYDLIAGSAGYLLLLLRMHSEEALPGMEDSVARLADHLVANVHDVDGLGWTRSPTSLPLCGLGHGRAGIGLALLEAGRFLGRDDLHSVGLQALEAEHRHRGDTPDQAWPDYRGLSRNERHEAAFGFDAWCSGSEGIALARSAALRISDARFLRDDLAFSATAIHSLRPNARPHLCCGQSGRILAHNLLRRQHGDLEFSEESRDPQVMAGLLESAMAPEATLMGIGLMQGLVGVVWAAMSMLEDDESNILLLQP